MINPVFRDDGIPLQHSTEQVSQFRNVPLTVSQLVQDAVYGMLRIHFEVLVESRIRGFHSEITSKEQNWLLKGGDNGLEDRPGYGIFIRAATTRRFVYPFRHAVPAPAD